MSSIDTLVTNAKLYAAQFTAGGLPAPPATGVAVVACMDARLDVHSLLGLADGDAHVIRNAGGVITDDVIRSLTISQRLLRTTEVMLIHHTGCGMMSFTDDEVKAQIEADTGLRPPFSLEAFAELDGNIRQSIARIKASPYLPHRDAVRGFSYDVAEGTLREVTAPLELPPTPTGARTAQAVAATGPPSQRRTDSSGIRNDLPMRTESSRPACTSR